MKTIVGGRGDERSSRRPGPNGVEILLKKAKVDSGFRDQLLRNPVKAAALVELQLTPAEEAVLRHTPTATLRSMIDRTKIPARYVPMLRTAEKAATLAAIIACCVSVPSLAAGGQEEGAMVDPLQISDPWESAIERMYVIQDALWYYHRDNGTYPSTDEWLRGDGAFADYVQRTLLFDPWHERFRYQGLTEQGVVVNYLLESTGEDLASPHDNIPCPMDAAMHSFDGPNPIVITVPQNGESFTGRSGETVDAAQVECTASHDNPRVVITWLLDGRKVGTTVGDHNIEIEISIGDHELVARDENEHEQSISVTVVQPEA